MRKYDEMTSHEISKMPFIRMPDIRLVIGKIERVADVALRNGIDWRKCLEALHILDRDPNFELLWYDGEEGGSVCVKLSEDSTNK